MVFLHPASSYMGVHMSVISNETLNITTKTGLLPSSLVLEALVLSSLTCTCKDPLLACSPRGTCKNKKKERERKKPNMDKEMLMNNYRKK